jgi:hypothetical protein
MFDQGIIQPFRSPRSLRVVLVVKKNGPPRISVDYRRLNAVTTCDVYRLLRIDDSFHALAGAKYFSTLNLPSAFRQIMLDEESRPAPENLVPRREGFSNSFTFPSDCPTHLLPFSALLIRYSLVSNGNKPLALMLQCLCVSLLGLHSLDHQLMCEDLGRTLIF